MANTAKWTLGEQANIHNGEKGWPKQLNILNSDVKQTNQATLFNFLLRVLCVAVAKCLVTDVLDTAVASSSRMLSLKRLEAKGQKWMPWLLPKASQSLVSPPFCSTSGCYVKDPLEHNLEAKRTSSRNRATEHRLTWTCWLGCCQGQS
jgi:hypothetical protein